MMLHMMFNQVSTSNPRYTIDTLKFTEGRAGIFDQSTKTKRLVAAMSKQQKLPKVESL